MIWEFGEYQKFVAATGYRNINYEQVEAYLKNSRRQARQIQFFDADLIASPQHLYFAALNTLQAFKSQTNISKSLAMETMLYAAAKNQIQKAIELLGIKANTTNMAVIVFGDNQSEVQAAIRDVSISIDRKPDEAILEIATDKMRKLKSAYSITELELQTTAKKEDTVNAVVDLVVERMSLLSTQI